MPNPAGSPPVPTLVRTSSLGWVALLLAAVLIYGLGLGGQYVPSNGDELVYSHIARLTAASGHWLPLVSDLDHMRNTKPPLLFWQAMLAGDWGRNWSMAALRAPSVAYTLLIALAVGALAQRLTQNLRQGLLAACIYLAFFFHFSLWSDLPDQCARDLLAQSAGVCAAVVALPPWA